MSLVFLPRQLVVDTNGQPRSGAKAYFYEAGSTTLIEVWKGADYAVLHENPVQSLASGLFPMVHIDPSVNATYKLVVKDSAEVTLSTDDDIPTEGSTLRQELADGDVELVGSTSVTYEQTPYELAAAVVPANKAAHPDDTGPRFGVVGDGTADDRAAIMNAYAVYKQGGPKLRINGVCKLLKNGSNPYALLFDGDVAFDGESKLKLVGDGTNEYNLIRITGGTDVKIDLRNIEFDHNKSVLVPASNDHICVRIESSIDTINIDNLSFTNYDCDGIYLRADVNGTGGTISNCRAIDGGRALISIAKGEKIRVINCTATDVGLQPFNIVPADNTTVLRHIDLINCSVYGGGAYGGAFATTDRCGFFLSGDTGADPDVQGDIRSINCRAIGFGIGAPGGVPLACGIETRECARISVIGFTAIGCRNIGIYSYQTDRVVVRGCFATDNDIGIGFNDCDNITESCNTSDGNTTSQIKFNIDVANTFLQADSLNRTLARGNVSIPAGTPTLNGGFGVAGFTDNGVGDTTVTLTAAANGTSYSAVATLRASSGLKDTIKTFTHDAGAFRVLTFSDGVAADQPFDFTVTGAAVGTIEQ